MPLSVQFGKEIKGDNLNEALASARYKRQHESQQWNNEINREHGSRLNLTVLQTII